MWRFLLTGKNVLVVHGCLPKCNTFPNRFKVAECSRDPQCLPAAAKNLLSNLDILPLAKGTEGVGLDWNPALLVEDFYF